jgi:hypothetical protein
VKPARRGSTVLQCRVGGEAGGTAAVHAGRPLLLARGRGLNAPSQRGRVDRSLAGSTVQSADQHVHTPALQTKQQEIQELAFDEAPCQLGPDRIVEIRVVMELVRGVDQQSVDRVDPAGVGRPSVGEGGDLGGVETGTIGKEGDWPSTPGSLTTRSNPTAGGPTPAWSPTTPTAATKPSAPRPTASPPTSSAQPDHRQFATPIRCSRRRLSAARITEGDQQHPLRET